MLVVLKVTQLLSGIIRPEIQFHEVSHYKYQALKGHMNEGREGGEGRKKLRLYNTTIS